MALIDFSPIPTPDQSTAVAALAAQRAGMTVNTQAGTTYTFALTDTYELGTALCIFANANPVTVTIPKNSVVALPVGHRIECEATGAGKVSIAPVDGDVTLVPATTRSIAAINKAVTLVQVSANVWHMFGALIA